MDAPADTRVIKDSGADSADSNEVAPDAIFPTEDTTTAKVCDLPAGTTPTATSAYMSAPSDAIDRNLGTLWNSGGYTGSFKLVFPKPISFDRVRIAAMSLPDSSESYSLSASSKIGEGTRALTGSTTWLEPFVVTPGTYSELTIDIAMSASWITLAEVSVFDSTGGCPSP